MLDIIEKYIVLIKENKELKRLIDGYNQTDEVSNVFDMDYILGKRIKKAYENNVELLNNFEYYYNTNVNNLSSEELIFLINKLTVNLKDCLNKLDKAIEEENDLKIVTEILELNDDSIDTFYNFNRRIFFDYIYCYTYFINDLQKVLKTKNIVKKISK